MKPNLAKRKLAAGEVVLGMNLSFSHAGMAEYLGLLGFDCVVADGEHADVSDRFIEELARAAEVAGVSAILRTAADAQTIERYLALGIHGISCPSVRSAQQVKNLMHAVKFSPEGGRGIGGRAVNYVQGDLAEMTRSANQETMVILKVESTEGIAALPEILAIDGVDVILIAHMDLSASLGVTGQIKHPLVLETIGRAVRLINEAGKVAGLPISSADDIKTAIATGARYLSTSSTNCLRKGAQPLLDAISHR